MEAPSDSLLTIVICGVCVILSPCGINFYSDLVDISKKSEHVLIFTNDPPYPLHCSSNNNNDDDNNALFWDAIVWTRSTELLQKAASHYLRVIESGQILLSKTALSNTAVSSGTWFLSRFYDLDMHDNSEQNNNNNNNDNDSWNNIAMKSCNKLNTRSTITSKKALELNRQKPYLSHLQSYRLVRYPPSHENHG